MECITAGSVGNYFSSLPKEARSIKKKPGNFFLKLRKKSLLFNIYSVIFNIHLKVSWNIFYIVLHGMKWSRPTQVRMLLNKIVVNVQEGVRSTYDVSYINSCKGLEFSDRMSILLEVYTTTYQFWGRRSLPMKQEGNEDASTLCAWPHGL